MDVNITGNNGCLGERRVLEGLSRGLIFHAWKTSDIHCKPEARQPRNKSPALRGVGRSQLRETGAREGWLRRRAASPGVRAPGGGHPRSVP